MAKRANDSKRRAKVEQTEPAATQTALQPAAAAEASLSPAQKAFKQLIEKIDTAELRIKQVTAWVDEYRSVYAQKLHPLREEQIRLAHEMVVLLDAALLRKKWTANQRETMLDILIPLAEMLLSTAHNEAMLVVLDRHGEGEEFGEESESTLAAELEVLLGVDLRAGADHPLSDDELLDAAARMVDEERHRRVEEQASHSARRGGKKSARQVKVEQEAIDADKMLKDIYRRLTSVLHPDREPDAAERARKTALMSEANQAYENKNLMKLLQLQLQASHIDTRAAMAFADDRLQVVNRSLRRQLDMLAMEQREIEMMVRHEFELASYGVIRATTIETALKRKVALHTQEIRLMRSDIGSLKRGGAHFVEWLKEQRRATLARERAEDAYVRMQRGLEDEAW